MKIKDFSISALLLVFILLIWEISSRLFNIPAYILPSPLLIFKTFFDFKFFGSHLLVTFEEMVLGILLALLFGLPLAFFMFRFPIFEKAMFPLIIGSQAIPVFAIAPLLVLWFGYGINSKIVMTAIIVFFPIVVNTLDGLKSADPDMVNLLKTMGATESQIILKVRIPYALPQFFTGLKIGASVSTIGAVIGEWVGSTKGLGYLMIHANAQLRVDVIFASIFYLTILGVGLFGLTLFIEKRALPWLYIGKT